MPGLVDAFPDHILTRTYVEVLSLFPAKCDKCDRLSATVFGAFADVINDPPET